MDRCEHTTSDDARIVAEGRSVLDAGARCLGAIAAGLGPPFAHAARAILRCPGQLVVTGIGKAGHVAKKVSSTFASTGTQSIYLHPTEAIHGDLGRVRMDDVVLALSNSGSSEEIVRLIPPLRSIGAKLLAITSADDAPLAREADVALCYGRLDEAGRLGLAPTTSTTALLALGDALAMAVLAERDFSPAEFARYHPGGALGRSLLRVADVMRRGDKNPVIAEQRPLFEALHVMSQTPGRPGSTSVVDGGGHLVGFYTDGDFRRNVETAIEADSLAILKRPIRDFMTLNPKTIGADRLASEAIRVLREMRIDQLPVVDGSGAPIGLVDVQDLLDVRVLG